MRNWLKIGLLTAGALSPTLVSAGQAEPGLVLQTVRSYRPDSKQTRVTAFIQIPYTLMDPTVEGSASRLSYRVEIKVRDSTGLALYEQAWPGHAPAGFRAPGASALETIEFGVAPGAYRLSVLVEDSVSGRRLDSSADIQGFLGQPAASDLILSSLMRLATSQDSIPKPGEQRRGNTIYTPAPELRLTPLRGRAYYMLEAYSAQTQTGMMSVAVTDSSGHAMVNTPATPVQVGAGGAVLKGQLDLAGLPAGKYRLTVGLKLGEQSVERSGELVMADLEETVTKASVVAAVNRVSDEGYFAEMGDADLDKAVAPLIYLADPGELSVYSPKLSLAAKRKFLTEFWQKRDPTKDTPANEVREAFYAKIEHANKAYAEGGRRATSGWRTDRGRIYAKYGEPDEVLDRRAAGKAPPYQVWRFSRNRDRYFIFVDRSGFGAYVLVESNDLSEARTPGWRELLGPDALQDVGRFLNIDFFQNDR